MQYNTRVLKLSRSFKYYRSNIVISTLPNFHDKTAN